MSVSILLVDDADMDRYLMKRYLKKAEIDVVLSEVCDGEEAIEFFTDYTEKQIREPERHPPLLIFLDINMPKMNGFQFLDRFEVIREQHNLDATVVVMFTSSPREEDKAQALRWDFVKDYMIKGDFDAAQLSKVIDNVQQNR